MELQGLEVRRGGHGGKSVLSLGVCGRVSRGITSTTRQGSSSSCVNGKNEEREVRGGGGGRTGSQNGDGLSLFYSCPPSLSLFPTLVPKALHPCRPIGIAVPFGRKPLGPCSAAISDFGDHLGVVTEAGAALQGVDGSFGGECGVSSRARNCAIARITRGYPREAVLEGQFGATDRAVWGAVACFVGDGLSVVDSWIPAQLPWLRGCCFAWFTPLRCSKTKQYFLYSGATATAIDCSTLQHPTNGRSSDVPPLNTDPKTRDAPSCKSRLGIGTRNGG